MNTLSFFGIIALVFHAATSFANDKQDIESLRQQVLNAATQHYQQAFGHAMFEERIKLTVGTLDRRLKLIKCDDNLTFEIMEPPQNVHNVTVKTRCNKEQRWTIYVPLTVDVYADVLVAKANLQKGDMLTAENLNYKRVNIAPLGHGPIEDLARASGMLLKRPLKSGAILRHSYLEKPTIVRKGQTVILTSKSRFLSVETAGVALGNGHLGQNIKVKNANSNKVLEAQVVAPGKVIVAIR